MLKDVCEKLGLKPVCGSLEKKYNGVYAGDLLSWVMSHADSGNIWVTIMSNLNVIAVASLTDVACVILAEGVTVTDDIINVAKEKNVTVLLSEKPVYEICAGIAKLDEI